jgi:hypothetical protein
LIKVALAIVTVIALALVITARNGEPISPLLVQTSQLGHGQFAIIESNPSFDQLFFGQIDGSEVFALQSAGSFSGLSIVDSAQLLVLERLNRPVRLSRILKVSASDKKVTCTVLITSQDYLGNPVYSIGSKRHRLFFITGKVNVRTDGLAVNKNYLAVYDNEEFNVLGGDTFLQISNLAAIDENSFAAVSPKIQHENSMDSDGSNIIEDRLVRIIVRDDAVDAEWFPAPMGALENLFSVTSLPGNSLGFLYSYEHTREGRKQRITQFDLSSGVEISQVDLPSTLSFGNAFSESMANEQLIVRVPSITRSSAGEHSSLAISVLLNKQVVDVVKVPLTVSNRDSTDICGGEPKGFSFSP